MPRGGPCAAERRPRTTERRPLCRRDEAPVPRGGSARRFSVLRGLEEATVSGGGSLCRMVLPYPSMLRGLREAPMPRGGPCAAKRRPRTAERRPRTAERRPLCCREEAPEPPPGTGAS